MPSPAEDRSRVVAVINALKVDGIRVKNWKNYLNGASPNNDHLRKESQFKFAFGRDLSLIPRCHVEDAGGTVSKFLVDACEFLSHHLHTEGLFRKTGSLIRIRSLRAGLEQGHHIFSQPYSATLQPCDVASLLKQFLRELPSPLIPLDLQGPLCLAQCLEEEEEEEEEGSQERRRDEATLLLTALLPPTHTRALRYLCTFLRRAAGRCDENRMEVGNLALVIAPNLLQCPSGGSKLTASTERQLNKQAAVIKALITNADRIGAVPSSLVSMPPVAEGGEALPLVDGGRFQERNRLGVYRSLRRQRRRSVGEIFVDALSKLKTGLTTTGPSNPTDSHPAPQSPAGTTKRKSTEDPAPDAQGSAKKRRSLQDLRDNNQPVKQCSDDAEASVGQSCSTLPVLSGVEGSREQEACVTLNAAEKRNRKIYNRLTAEENQAQRRRTLRFFNMDGQGASIGNAPENWTMESSQKLTYAASQASVSEGDGSARIPAILVEGPERVVRENEVEDDPELLNYSFAEDPLDPPGPPSGMRTVKRQFQRSYAVWGDEASDGTDGQNDISSDWGGQAKTEVQHLAEEAGPDKRPADAEGSSWVSLRPRRPRRSLSMPEVTLIPISGRDDDPQGEGAGDRSLLIMQEDEAPEEVWPVWADLEKRRPQRGGAVTSGGDRGAGKERRDESKKQEKKEKQAGFKRGMSVAERLRRFNALAMLLRTPRAPAPPPGPLLPDVLNHTLLAGRLHRQGARRFGRSISHDGALEPGSVGQRRRQEEEEEEPEVVQAPRQPAWSAPTETTARLGTSGMEPVLEAHPSPREYVLQTAPAQTPLRTPGRPEERRGPPRPAEEIAKKTDLHELLQVHLNLRDSKQVEGKDVAGPEQQDRQTQTDVPRQIKALVRQDAQITEAQPTPPAPRAMHLYTESCSLTVSIATQTDRATPQDNGHTTHPEAVCSASEVSELHFVAVDVDRCPRPVDTSPTTLPFKSRATRRRYRDSPRWHVHEISMTTGDPVHI